MTDPRIEQAEQVLGRTLEPWQVPVLLAVLDSNGPLLMQTQTRRRRDPAIVVALRLMDVMYAESSFAPAASTTEENQ